jgi:hypothetical protein
METTTIINILPTVIVITGLTLMLIGTILGLSEIISRIIIKYKP